MAVFDGVARFQGVRLGDGGEDEEGEKEEVGEDVH